MVKSTQFPESVYVKTNEKIIYQIEYEIPRTMPSLSPEEQKVETGVSDMLIDYIPQILGSVKFL